MKLLTISLLAIATLFNISANAACPVANVTLATQAEVDAFAATYPGCTTWPAGIELKVKGDFITNLNGLSVLEHIDGHLTIEWCRTLTDITGLANIETVHGQLQFEECHMIANLDALSGITSCHDLEIQGLNALTSISGLNGLTSLSGDLHIKDCDMLINLTGLEGITSISGYLQIDQNQSLTDLTALSNLTSVGGSVKILSNRDLTSLDGLDNITSIGGGIDIKDNPNLEFCIGACRMLDALLPTENAYFSGNKPGTPCNNINTLDTECLIALPVELIGFRAKEDAKKQNVVVDWTTASELNNKHFEVERATDGRTFKTIGTVAGNGTTSKANNYKFVDAQPVAMAYYRLKQVDFAGEFSYSDLVLVKMSKKTEAAKVDAYPTIAKNEITIRFTGFETQSGTFNVFNAQGRLVHTEIVDLSNKMAYKSLNVAKFNTGIYTIVISDNASNITSNFVVVK